MKINSNFLQIDNFLRNVVPIPNHYRIQPYKSLLFAQTLQMVLKRQKHINKQMGIRRRRLRILKFKWKNDIVSPGCLL